MTETDASSRCPAWDLICLDAERDRGAIVRFHWRPLPPNIWSRLAWRYGYHTWMELLDRDGRPLDCKRRMVWGVYEGRHIEGDREGKHNGIAEAKWMNWEYVEDGGLERWGQVGRLKHGFLDAQLPEFTHEDLKEIQAMVYDDVIDNLGRYGYLLPWFGPLLGVWNCQRYVRVYCRQRGGPPQIFHELGRRFWRGE